jgi:hypothetical protein
VITIDPYFVTILKEAGLLLLGFTAAGLVVAMIYGLYRYADLKHAMTLAMVPPQIA